MAYKPNRQREPQTLFHLWGVSWTIDLNNSAGLVTTCRLPILSALVMCLFASAEMQCPSPSGVANEVSWVYKKLVASVSYDRICPFEADLTNFHRVELMRTDARVYATFMSCCPTAADRDRYHYSM